MSRILAIDYGTKNIGLAVSDEQKKFAFPYKSAENNFAQLKKIIRLAIEEKDVSAIVVGLPVKFDGSPHEIAADILKFADKLKKEFGIPIYFEEERFTSAQARKLHGKSKYNHAVAASFILENYLQGRRAKQK